MTTYTVSYFKNHALKLLDHVKTSGEGLLITRRGKPLARVEPVLEKTSIELGKLKGTMEILEDLTAPLGDDDWAASQ